MSEEKEGVAPLTHTDYNRLDSMILRIIEERLELCIIEMEKLLFREVIE